MTEAEWLAAAEPFFMISHLENARRVLQFKAGRRKARLLACAWCRPLLPHVSGDWAGAIVEVVERFADGLASKGDLTLARQVATENGVRANVELMQALRGGPGVRAGLWVATWAAGAMRYLAAESSPVMLANLNHHLLNVARLAPGWPDRCAAVREVFGNPFRPVKVAPAWLRHHDGAARRLAATIYEARAFGDAPVLADALEDAGCEDEAVLGHLRGPGPHVPGCWVIDLILGKG